LGVDAKLIDLQNFIRERFGLEMSTNHIASSRSDISRKEKAAANKTAEQAPAPSPTPAPAPPVSAAAAPAPPPAPAVAPAEGPRINKTEAVRRALAELGNEATSLDIQGFARDRFGLDVPPDLAKKYKS